MVAHRHCERSAAIQTLWRLPLDCRVAALLAMTVAGCSGQPLILPGGIVSNNPCIDGILAEIAAPGEITAVSIYSHDAASGSAPLAWARAHTALGTSAEEIILARPRLVLTGNLASSGTNAALAKAGVKVLGFGVPASVEESIVQVRQVALAIGRVEAGELLVGRIHVAAPLKPSPLQGRGLGEGSVIPNTASNYSPLSPEGKRGKPTAIIWQSGGFVPGKGSVQDELLSHAGFRNASATYGLGQWGQLPLETLIRNPPDVIFAAKPHPMFARLKNTRVVLFPDRLNFCAGPTIIAAMQVLRQGDMR
jgi:iron complex transport system substrate-binding protein